MPVFPPRTAGLHLIDSASTRRFKSPVPSNPLLIPGFVKKNVAPYAHTHSQGDITGLNVNSAQRVLFFSIGPETDVPGKTGTSTYHAFTLQVRDGNGSAVPSQYHYRVFRGQSNFPGPSSINDTVVAKYSQPTGSGIVYATTAGTNGNEIFGLTPSTVAGATWYLVNATLKKSQIGVEVGGMFRTDSAQWNGT